MKKTAILLSGGIDSISVLYWKRPDFAFTVDYSQNSALGEIRASKQVCKELKIKHEVIKCDISELGSGDLSIRPPNKYARESEWWPYRNQFIITLAAMKCINYDINKLLVGCIKTDSFFKDSRKKFIEKIDNLMYYQEGKIRISAPAIQLTSSGLVKKSKIPFGVLAWAHSCHKSEIACGHCRGCNKHKKVMEKVCGIYY